MSGTARSGLFLNARRGLPKTHPTRRKMSGTARSGLFLNARRGLPKTHPTRRKMSGTARSGLFLNARRGLLTSDGVIGRDSSPFPLGLTNRTVAGFHPPPRQTERAHFEYSAFLFASQEDLWDVANRRCFRS